MQTVRQAFTILKQNPLLSTISILGTAFAITMIMAIVITWQTKYADLEPEVNRSRCLYFSAMHVYDKEKDGNNNWTKVSHPLKHQLFSFSFVCLPPYPLTVNTCLTEVMQTIHILRPIFPTLQPLQGFCSSLCRFR